LIILVSIFDLNFSVFVQPGISLLFTLQSYGGADRLQGPGKATIWKKFLEHLPQIKDLGFPKIFAHIPWFSVFGAPPYYIARKKVK
jgi:hypothetical protein